MRRTQTRGAYGVFVVLTLVVTRGWLLRLTGSHVIADAIAFLVGVMLLLPLGRPFHWSLWVLAPGLGAVFGLTEDRITLPDSAWKVLTLDSVYYGLFVASVLYLMWRFWPTREQSVS
jgi:hypothetical protein